MGEAKRRSEEIEALKAESAERDEWADDLVADAAAILAAARRYAEETVPVDGFSTRQEREAAVEATTMSLSMVASQRAIGQDVGEALAEALGDRPLPEPCCDFTLAEDGSFEVIHEPTCENYEAPEDPEDELPSAGPVDPTAP